MPQSKVKQTALNMVQPGLPRPLVNVVLLHGLNEDWYKSWGLDQKDSWSTHLREACPEANLWSEDYRIHWSEAGGGSMNLYERALNVLATIDIPLDDDLPIVLMGHSYGGILMKEMLRTGSQQAH